MLSDVQAQVRRGIAQGLPRDSMRTHVEVTRWRDRFAGTDPVLRYFFRQYFSDPNTERTFDAMVSPTTR